MKCNREGFMGMLFGNKRISVLNDSHFGNTLGKASLILRLSFGYASIVPDWEKWAKKLVVTYTNSPTI